MVLWTLVAISLAMVPFVSGAIVALAILLVVLSLWTRDTQPATCSLPWGIPMGDPAEHPEFGEFSQLCWSCEQEYTPHKMGDTCQDCERRLQECEDAAHDEWAWRAAQHQQDALVWDSIDHELTTH
jgi:hypothetical protein